MNMSGITSCADLWKLHTCTKEGQLRQGKESDLHPEAISRESTVSLATAVGTAQRLDYLYQHGQSQAVGTEAGALFLFTWRRSGGHQHEPTGPLRGYI